MINKHKFPYPREDCGDSNEVMLQVVLTKFCFRTLSRIGGSNVRDDYFPEPIEAFPSPLED